jgi:hypothetical protein
VKSKEPLSHPEEIVCITYSDRFLLLRSVSTADCRKFSSQPVLASIDQFRPIDHKLQAFEWGESGKNQKSDFLIQKLHVSLTLPDSFLLLLSVSIVDFRKFAAQPLPH